MLNQIKVTTKWLLSLTLTTLLSTTIHAYDLAGDGAAGDSMSDQQKTDAGISNATVTTYDTAGYAAAASQVSNYNEALQARHETAQGKAGTTTWSRDINAAVGDIKMYHSAKHSNAVINGREAFNIAFSEKTDSIELGTFNGYYDLKDDSIVYNQDETNGISGNYGLGAASWWGAEEFQIQIIYETFLNNPHPDITVHATCQHLGGSSTTQSHPQFIQTVATQVGFSNFEHTDATGFDTLSCQSYLSVSDNLDGASIASLDDLIVQTSVQVLVSSP